MAMTDKLSVRENPFVSPGEESAIAQQNRKDSLQNIDQYGQPLHIGEYDPNTLEGQEAYNSVVSESGISGRLRRARQEIKTRYQNQSRGEMQMKGDGLSSTLDLANPQSKETNKFGKSFGNMRQVMGSLRQQARDAKNQRKNAVGELEEKAADFASKPISMATSNLLQKSWLNIIDSFGLTLLYINFHVFCRWVFGEKLFCKLGQEWLGNMGGGMGKAAGTAAKAEGAAAKAESGAGGAGKSLFGLPERGIGVLESALLILLDLIVLYAILMTLLPYIIMIAVVSDPQATITFLTHVGQTIIDLILGVLK